VSEGGLEPRHLSALTLRIPGLAVRLLRSSPVWSRVVRPVQEAVLTASVRRYLKDLDFYEHWRNGFGTDEGWQSYPTPRPGDSPPANRRP
jgi:hypothetical protein